MYSMQIVICAIAVFYVSVFIISRCYCTSKSYADKSYSLTFNSSGAQSVSLRLDYGQKVGFGDFTQCISVV